MAEIVHEGVWWDPKEPEQEWVGALRFDGENGAILTVIVPSEKPTLFPPLRSYDTILGITTASKRVTLFRCFDQSSSGVVFPRTPSKTEIFANAFLVGFHCDDPNPPISKAVVSFGNLDTWWGGSSISQETAAWPALAVHYAPPSPVVLADTPSLRVTVRSALSGSSGDYAASFREEILVDIDSATPRPLPEFLGLVQECGDFFSIAALALADTDELSLAQHVPGSDKESPWGTYHGVPHYRRKRSSRRSPDRYLFRRADIQDRTQEVFTAWLSHALYFSGAYGEGYAEARFLPLSQALEAFHGRFHEGVYMDPVAYEQAVLPQLTAAIPATVDPSHRQALMSRLKYGNTHSLRRRLTDLVAEHEAALACVTRENPKRFIEPIVRYRNDFTHHPDGAEAVRRDERFGERVVALSYVLRSLLEFSFLKVMGFSASEIQSLAQRCETYREVTRRFFAEQ